MSELKHPVLARAEAVLHTMEVFYKARWSQVKEGDTVLVGDHCDIKEARVVEIGNYDFDGRDRFKIALSPIGSRTRYVSVCWPGDTVYIKSRF